MRSYPPRRELSPRDTVGQMLNYPQLDKLFSALADPTRRLIFERLCDEEVSVSRLARPLYLSLPAVMQQVRVLERSGLICTTKTGRTRSCRIEPQSLRLLEQWIRQRCGYWHRRQPGYPRPRFS
jgi:DNA-binding transcriptional ArsR family regulator